MKLYYTRDVAIVSLNFNKGNDIVCNRLTTGLIRKEEIIEKRYLSDYVDKFYTIETIAA